MTARRQLRRVMESSPMTLRLPIRQRSRLASSGRATGIRPDLDVGIALGIDVCRPNERRRGLRRVAVAGRRTLRKICEAVSQRNGVDAAAGCWVGEVTTTWDVSTQCLLDPPAQEDDCCSAFRLALQCDDPLLCGRRSTRCRHVGECHRHAKRRGDRAQSPAGDRAERERLAQPLVVFTDDEQERRAVGHTTPSHHTQ